MKLRIAIGDVELRLDGLELSKRQVVELLREAGSIALAVGPIALEPEPDLKHIGFTAHLDLDPERNQIEDLSEWFEESP